MRRHRNQKSCPLRAPNAAVCLYTKILHLFAFNDICLQFRDMELLWFFVTLVPFCISMFFVLSNNIGGGTFFFGLCSRKYSRQCGDLHHDG